MASEPVLRVDDVHTFYGSIEALKGISLEVHDGEIVTLIGANGAGKSTTLRSINGLNHPRNGKIYFQGTDVTSMPPHQIVKRGISQSPEGRKLFPRSSARIGARSRRTLTVCSRSSRASRNGALRRRAPCPAASSRCSRSGAR